MSSVRFEKPSKLIKIQLFVGSLGFVSLAVILNSLTSNCPADVVPLADEIERWVPAVSGLLIYLRQQQSLELSPDIAACRAALTIAALLAWLLIVFVAHWVVLFLLGRKMSTTALVGSVAQMPTKAKLAIVCGGWALLQLPLAYFLLSPTSLTRSGIGFDFAIWWLKLVSMFILSMAGLIVGADSLFSAMKPKTR
jgi:hypothetical protein